MSTSSPVRRPTRGGAREGVLAWLGACLRAAEARGVPCLVRSSSLHHKGQRWIADHGFRLYSASCLERRFREVREWGLAPAHGFLVTLVQPGDTDHRPSSERVWRVTRAEPTTTTDSCSGPISASPQKMPPVQATDGMALLPNPSPPNPSHVVNPFAWNSHR